MDRTDLSRPQPMAMMKNILAYISLWITRCFLALCAVFFLVNCDPLWPDAEWRSGRYVLIAIDAPEQMGLVFHGDERPLETLVGPTIFSIGANNKYIVLMQHPNIKVEEYATEWSGGPTGKKTLVLVDKMDRTLTNYYVLERTESLKFADRKKGIRGPLTKEEFDKLTIELALPPFSKTFDDLK